MYEIFIAIVIAIVALFILVKSGKKKMSGECDCSNCSSKCPMYNKDK